VQKDHEAEDKLYNLEGDWQSKYDSMCEEYEQKIETLEK
jgi:hypothetical protein